jgi:hypothetical protein
MFRLDPSRKAGSAEAGAVERRAAVRFTSRRRASCDPISARGFAYPVRIRDVSTHGIGLIADRRFERKTLLIVEVRGGDPDIRSPIVARVVHVSALPARNWLIGCEFLSKLSDAEVQAIVRDVPADPPPDERSSA